VVPCGVLGAGVHEICICPETGVADTLTGVGGLAGAAAGFAWAAIFGANAMSKIADVSLKKLRMIAP
jgi:hypothetical protein